MIITAVAALSLGGIIGNVGDTAPTAEPSATATTSKPAGAKSAPSASKAPEAKKTTEPVAESTIGEGTYQIGVDLCVDRGWSGVLDAVRCAAALKLWLPVISAQDD